MAEIDRYFKLMVEHGASDLHYCTGCKPMFRKDGIMLPLKNDPEIDDQRARTILYEIMPKKNEDEFNEMRDLETTHIAIETAETGHLVFGTLHTTTAISTVDRLIDQFWRASSHKFGRCWATH
jgi:Tfp pilus assembly pilus retraction ATPase PilT